MGGRAASGTLDCICDRRNENSLENREKIERQESGLVGVCRSSNLREAISIMNEISYLFDTHQWLSFATVQLVLVVSS